MVRRLGLLLGRRLHSNFVIRTRIAVRTSILFDNSGHDNLDGVLRQSCLGSCLTLGLVVLNGRECTILSTPLMAMYAFHGGSSTTYLSRHFVSLYLVSLQFLAKCYLVIDGTIVSVTFLFGVIAISPFIFIYA